MNGEKTSAYKLLVRKPEGKGLQGRPRHRWMYNIKLGLEEMEWSGLDLSTSELGQA
jgi:hypothetical protein